MGSSDSTTKSGKRSAGGWGSVRGMMRIAGNQQPLPGVLEDLARLNKPGGLMCTSCAWPKPANYKALEFCENGAKATIWETTSARATPKKITAHRLSELRQWADHDLEKLGRLTAPMRYDATLDRYTEATWDEAFRAIAAKINAHDPDATVFYASGHAGLEASYLYALLARAHGTNNLPQSSNMCHETTSVGLKKVIGSPVGTVIWEDLEQADAFFFFGQNPGTNSPRFLHPLSEAKKRGAKIVTFNPVREAGLTAFVDPQSPSDMLTGRETKISDLYCQLRPGGDIAALAGLCKAVIAADDAALASGQNTRILDTAFIEQHTTGFDAFIARMRETGWEEIERESGLKRSQLEEAARIYMGAGRVIGVYGMGLTQHVNGALNIAMLVNFLMLRGNMGREGAGICPVRGHSNVQGQRTVGIAEKAALAPSEALERLFGVTTPEKDGVTVVESLDAMREGRIRNYIQLGGNLLRALPDRDLVEELWPKLDLTVAISTRLNRSHLFPGADGWILPCLTRSEKDMQATGNQTVTIEDSFSCIHGSLGHRNPVSKLLKSELAIVAGLAEAVLPPDPRLRWSDWCGDYGLVRQLIEETYPDMRGMSEGMNRPGGHWRGNPARARQWKTEPGRAIFTTPDQMRATGHEDASGRYTLITMRSNDQFNTTIYGYSDRLRGLSGSRMVLLMNPEDIRAAGLEAGQVVTLASDHRGHGGRLEGLTVTAFDLPRGALGGYYPECNVLIPHDLHDGLSKTPASKGVPVRIEVTETPQVAQ